VEQRWCGGDMVEMGWDEFGREKKRCLCVKIFLGCKGKEKFVADSLFKGRE